MLLTGKSAKRVNWGGGLIAKLPPNVVSVYLNRASVSVRRIASALEIAFFGSMNDCLIQSASVLMAEVMTILTLL